MLLGSLWRPGQGRKVYALLHSAHSSLPLRHGGGVTLARMAAGVRGEGQGQEGLAVQSCGPAGSGQGWDL